MTICCVMFFTELSFW